VTFEPNFVFVTSLNIPASVG